MDLLECITISVVLATAITVILYQCKNIGYLWECRKPREYRFKDKVPVCEFWTFEGSYEEFRKKFAGKSHHDWCVFDRHEGKLRAGVRDMGIRLHWKCHFGFHIIQERLIGPLKEKNKILHRYRHLGRRKLKKINELTLMEEIFRRHYHELAGYRYVLTQQIDLEEKKRNTASMVMASVLTVLIAVGLAIYIQKVTILWPITMPIFVMLAIALNNYLNSAVKSHEVKDAMYFCLGIDEDHPKLPGVPEKPHEEFPKEVPEVTDP